MSFDEEYPGVKLANPEDLADELRNLRIDELLYVIEVDGERHVGLSTQSAEELEELIKALEDAIELVSV